MHKAKSMYIYSDAIKTSSWRHYIYIPKVHKNILNNNNLGKANSELLKGKVIGHFDPAHKIN